MTSLYGPQDWDSREASKMAFGCLDLQDHITHGERLWVMLGEEPHADAFWDVVSPLAHALAAKCASDSGYGEGFSATTACEQLMHEVAIAHREEVLS